ncbi:MAG TPA: AlkA N-terminal domain-containing protein [Polyangiales bacterium]|nr:AlkA N-terminal domain-containing protein [Polyangiales bacterium]
MSLDAAACYRALCARDTRFDGVFYVAVTSTGVYCRPICPARTPRASSCEFYPSAALAERAGFRACLRCRPELAPGLASVDAVSRLAQAAAARIDAGFLNDHGLDELADSLGVTSRHLRRAVQQQLGASPVELAQHRRLALAKHLLQDSTLSVTDVAYASGFGSVRRFNTLVQQRFGRAPSALRRTRAAASRSNGHDSETVDVRLDYRPPLDFAALLSFLRGRAIAGVEHVTDTHYRRSVVLDDTHGMLEVSADPARHALRLRISLSLANKLMPLVARVRALFDLDARPDLIAAHLGRDPVLRKLVKARPGLRVPGAFDGFETAVRAVLGQQVSVRGATTLSGRVATRFGRELPELDDNACTRAFPDAACFARLSLADVRAIGLPEARARTLLALAEAVASQRSKLEAGGDPEAAITELQRLPGIGPWTAQYLGMRVLRWPDSFPAGDLVLRKALGMPSERAAEQRAEAWRPFRAYAVMHLWASTTKPGG